MLDRPLADDVRTRVAVVHVQGSVALACLTHGVEVRLCRPLAFRKVHAVVIEADARGLHLLERFAFGHELRDPVRDDRDGIVPVGAQDRRATTTTAADIRNRAD